MQNSFGHCDRKKFGHCQKYSVNDRQMTEKKTLKLTSFQCNVRLRLRILRGVQTIFWTAVTLSPDSDMGHASLHYSHSKMTYAMLQKFLNVSHHKRVCQSDIFLALIFAASGSKCFKSSILFVRPTEMKFHSAIQCSHWSVELRFAELLCFTFLQNSDIKRCQSTQLN